MGSGVADIVIWVLRDAVGLQVDGRVEGGRGIGVSVRVMFRL